MSSDTRKDGAGKAQRSGKAGRRHGVPTGEAPRRSAGEGQRSVQGVTVKESSAVVSTIALSERMATGFGFTAVVGAIKARTSDAALAVEWDETGTMNALVNNLIHVLKALDDLEAVASTEEADAIRDRKRAVHKELEKAFPLAWRGSAEQLKQANDELESAVGALKAASARMRAVDEAIGVFDAALSALKPFLAAFA